MPWAILIAAGASIVIALIGQAIASGDRAKAEQLRLEAAKKYNIPLPDLASFEKELATNTEMQKVVMDPQYEAAGREALSKTSEYAAGTGMMPEDLATLDAAKRSAGAYESGVRGANAQAMSARGISGSGIDASNQQAAMSGGIDRAYQGGIQAAGDASRRRYAALQDQGNLAARLSASDIALKSNTASAQDAINKFNYAEKSGNAQQGFNNQVDLAQGQANAMNGVANMYDANAQNTQNVAAGISSGVSEAGAGVAEYTLDENGNKIPKPKQ